MENNTSELELKNSKYNKNFIIGVVIAVILVISVYLFVSNQNKKVDSISENKQIKTYTLSDVAINNSKSSCWTVIDNNVYDVTNFISKHKGGDKILAVCGIDGTDLFTGKSPLGRAHGDLAKTLLSSMKIGNLQK